jgi:hypothetical protein
MNRATIALVAGFALVMAPVAAEAQRRGGGGGVSRGGGGGGGGGFSRGSAPKSINRPASNGGFNNNRPSSNGGYNNNRPGNNRPGNNRPGGNNNININNSTNVNVVGNNRHGGYHGGGGCCYNNGYDVWDAIGTAAAVTATVAVTSAIIGSITTTRPPDCVQSNYGNTTYLQCGSTWYQPAMAGSNVQYVVVSRPY